jgi:hypothetical protein
MNPPVPTVKVLYDIARRIGLDPDVNLAPDQAEEILGFMEDRLRESWEMYDFLEITETQERAFRDDYDINKCYAAGDQVWDPCTLKYYQAVSDGVGGPLSNAKIWTPYPNVAPCYVAWEQAGKTPIGAGFKAYNLNPYEEPYAQEIPFVISRRGLEFDPRTAPATIWVQFRLPYPGLAMYDWSATATYSAGDAVIYLGDTYHSLVSGNIGIPPDSSDVNWELFRIPYVLAKFVTQAAYSDTLIVNGQNEKAAPEEGKAYSRLSQEYDKQTLQQAQQQRFSVYTGT